MAEETEIQIEFTVGGIKKALKQLEDAYKEIRKLTTPDLGARISEIQSSIQKEITAVRKGYEEQLAAAQKSLSEINKEVKKSFRERENLNRKARKIEEVANQQTDSEMKALFQQAAQGERNLSKQKTKEYNLRKQEAQKVSEEIKNIEKTLADESYRSEADTSKLKQKLSELEKKKAIQDKRAEVASIKSQLKEATKAVAEEKKKEIQATTNALNKVLNQTKSVYGKLNEEQKKSVEKRIQEVASSYIEETNYHSKNAESKQNIEKRFYAIEQKLRNQFAKEEIARGKKVKENRKKQTEELLKVVISEQKKIEAVKKAGFDKLTSTGKDSITQEINTYRELLRKKVNYDQRSSKERIKIDQMVQNKKIELIKRELTADKEFYKRQLKFAVDSLNEEQRAFTQKESQLDSDQKRSLERRISNLRESLQDSVGAYAIEAKDRAELEKKINSIIATERKKQIDQYIRDNKKASDELKRDQKEQINDEVTLLRRKAQLISAGEEKLTYQQQAELNERVRQLRSSITQEIGIVERGSKQEKAIDQELYNYKKRLIKQFVQDNKKAQKQAQSDNKASTVAIKQFWKNTYSTINNLGKMAFGLTKSGLLSLGMQLQMMATDTLRVGVEFDKFITTLGAIRGVTRENIKPLEDQARLLGSTTLFTATQAAEGMQALARAGLETGQVIATSSDALKFAGANATTLYQSTSLLAATMKQFSFTANESGRIVDTFTAATQNSMFDVESLAVAMRYAGNVGSGMGAELEETVGVLAQFRDMGLEGSMVGTRFRQAMLRLSAPTIKAKKAMDKLKISYDEINPAKSGLLPALRRLAELNLSQEALVPIVGSKVVADFNKLIQGIRSTAEFDASGIKEGTSELEKFIAKLYEARGVNEQTYDIMVQSTSGQIDILKSAYQELQLTIFDALSGKQAEEAGVDQFATITRAVKIAQQVVYDLTTLFDQLGATIGQVIELEFGSTLQMFADGSQTFAINIIGVFFKLSTLIGNIIGFIKVFGNAILNLGVIFASAKIGQLIYGIGIALNTARIGFYQYVTASNAATASTNAFTVALMKNPLILGTAILTSVLAAVFAFGQFNDVLDAGTESANILESRLNALRAAQEAYNESTKVGYDSQVAHRVEIDNIIDSLKSRNELTPDLMSSLNNLKKLDEARMSQLIKQGKIMEVTGEAGQKMFMDHRTAALLANKADEMVSKGIATRYDELGLLSRFQKKFEEERKKALDLESKIYDSKKEQKKAEGIQKLQDIEEKRIESLVMKMQDLSGKEISILDEDQTKAVYEAFRFDEIAENLQKFTDQTIDVALNVDTDEESVDEIIDKLNSIEFKPGLGLDSRQLKALKQEYLDLLQSSELSKFQRLTVTADGLEDFYLKIQKSGKFLDQTRIKLGFIEDRVSNISKTTEDDTFKGYSESLKGALLNLQTFNDESLKIENRRKDSKLIDVKGFNRDAILVSNYFQELYQKREDSADNLANKTINEGRMFADETRKILQEVPKLKEFFLEDKEDVVGFLNELKIDELDSIDAEKLTGLQTAAQEFLGINQESAKNVIEQYITFLKVEKTLDALNKAGEGGEFLLPTLIDTESLNGFISFATFAGSFFDNLRKQSSQFVSGFSEIKKETKDAGKEFDKTTGKGKSLANQLDKLREKSLKMIAELKSDIKVLKDSTQEGVKGLEKQADAITELAEKEQKLAKQLGRSASRRLDTFERMTENINLLIERTALKTEKEYMKSYDSLKKEIRELQSVQSDAIAKIQQEENKRLSVLDNVTDKSFNQTVALLQKEADANVTKYKEMEAIVKKFGKSRNASNIRAVQNAKKAMEELGSIEQITLDKRDKINAEFALKQKRRSENRVLVAQATNQKLVNLTRDRLMEIRNLELQMNAENSSEFERIEDERRTAIKKTNQEFKAGIEQRKDDLQSEIDKVNKLAKDEVITKTEQQQRITDLNNRFKTNEEQALNSHRAIIDKTNEFYDKKRLNELDRMHKEAFGIDTAGYKRLYGVVEDYAKGDEKLQADMSKRLLDMNSRNTAERIRRLNQNAIKERDIRKENNKQKVEEIRILRSELDTVRQEMNKVSKDTAISPEVKTEQLKPLTKKLNELQDKISSISQKFTGVFADTEVDPFLVEAGIYEKILENFEKMVSAKKELTIVENALSKKGIVANKEYLDSLLKTSIVNGKLTKSQIRQLEVVVKKKKSYLDELQKTEEVYNLKSSSLFNVKNKKDIEESKERNKIELGLLEEKLKKLKEESGKLTEEELKKKPQLSLDISLLESEIKAYKEIIISLQQQLEGFGKTKIQLDFESNLQNVTSQVTSVGDQIKDQTKIVGVAQREVDALIDKQEKLQNELKGLKPQKQDKKIDKKRLEERKAEIQKELQEIEIEITTSDKGLGKAKLELIKLEAKHRRFTENKEKLDKEYAEKYVNQQKENSYNIISEEQALANEIAYIHQQNNAIRIELDKGYGTFRKANGERMSKEEEDHARAELAFQKETNEKIITAYTEYQNKVNQLAGLSVKERENLQKQHASNLSSALANIQKDFDANYPKPPEIDTKFVFEMEGFEKAETALGIINTLFEGVDNSIDFITDTSDERISQLTDALINVGTLGILPLLKLMESAPSQEDLNIIVAEKAQEAWNGITGAIENSVNALGEFLMKIPAVRQGIESISERAGKIEQAFKDSTVSGLDKTGIALKEGALIAVDAALMIAKTGIQIVPQILSQGAGLLLEKIGVMEQETFNKVLEVMSFVADGVKGIVSSLISGMRSAFDTMKGLFDSAVSYMISADLSLQANITGGANAIMEDAEKAKERLDHLNEQLAKGEISQAEYNEARAQGVGTANPEKAVEGFITNLVDEAVLFMESMAQAAPLVADKLIAQLPRIIEAFKTAFPTVLQALATGIPEIIGMAIQGINEVLPNLLSTISESLPQVITNIIKLVQDSIVPLISTLGTAISSVIDSIDFGALIDNLSTALFALLDSVLGAIETLVGKLPEIVGGILKKIPKLVGDLSTFIANLVTTLGEVLPDIINQLFAEDTFSELLDSLLEGIIKIGVAILAAIPDLITAIINALPKITGALVRAIPTILTALVNSIPVLVDALIRALPDLFMAIIMYIPTLVSELWKLITDGIGGFFDAIFEAVGKVLKSIGDFFTGIFDGIAEFFGLGGDQESYADTPGAVKAPSSGLSARFKGGDFVVAAQKPQEVLRQALELMNNTSQAIPMNSQVISEFAKLANTIPSVSLGTENMLGSLSNQNFGIQSPTMGMNDIIESMGRATGFAMRSAISQAITPLVQAQNMQRPTVETGSFRPINLSVVADGRVLDSVQVSAMNSGNAPKLKRKIRNMSGVNVGFSRGRYNNFSK